MTSEMKFADTYAGCQVLANIMGLNSETVRKRAKAGKIPGKQNVRGTWLFQHKALFEAGIHPFNQAVVPNRYQSPQAPLVPPVEPARINRTEVIFVLDRSGSMAGLEAEVRKGLTAQFQQLKGALGPSDRYNISIINFSGDVALSLTGRPIVTSDPPQVLEGYYLRCVGGTALYDAIGRAIETTHVRDDGNTAFLISIMTDGYENASKRFSLAAVSGMIRQAMATDRYTFAFAGPEASARVAGDLGIPPGNCTTWESTVEGLATLSRTTTNSLKTYAASRSSGVMRSTSFYAEPVIADASKFVDRLGGDLLDVTQAVTVARVNNDSPLTISKFAKAAFGSFVKGGAYYELTSSEKVQDYKGIIVQDTKTGRFYSGWSSAKRLLGIPDFTGTVRIRPGKLGDFRVFVQSTSLNRRLVPGTVVVSLSNKGP